jgi:hypothetical protein
MLRGKKVTSILWGEQGMCADLSRKTVLFILFKPYSSAGSYITVYPCGIHQVSHSARQLATFVNLCNSLSRYLG